MILLKQKLSKSKKASLSSHGIFENRQQDILDATPNILSY